MTSTKGDELTDLRYSERVLTHVDYVSILMVVSPLLCLIQILTRYKLGMFPSFLQAIDTDRQPDCVCCENWVAMFLSQDLLLDRHSGVATVWLLSTLGQKSSYKKVSRKEIQAVSVPEACSVIKNPPKPLGLRVTSNLLYGVTLIHRQKTDYLNNDVSVIKTKLQRDLFQKNTTGSGFKNINLAAPLLIFDLDQFNQNGLAHPDIIARQGNAQVLLNDDPMFNIKNGLLPAIDDLSFLVDGGGNNSAGSVQKDQIKQFDIENNTRSIIFSTITQSTGDFDDNDLFTGNNLQSQDVLGNDNPNFVFNDDGMLLSLNGETTVDQEPTLLNDEFDQIDLDFNLDLNDGYDAPEHNANTLVGAHVLQDIVSEQLPTEAPQASMKLKRKRRTVANYTTVVIDDIISLNTNDLRSFRDDYVTNMQLQKPKRRKASLRTVNSIMMEYDWFKPSLSQRNVTAEPDTSEADFVDALLRNSRSRRSTDSIETRRNASLSRRNSRASISGVNLPIGENTGGHTVDVSENDREGDFFDIDLGDILTDPVEVDQRSKKRSSSSVQRFPTVREQAEDLSHDFANDADEDRVRIAGGDGEAEEFAVLEKAGRQTLKFLTYIEDKMDEKGTNEIIFEELFEQQSVNKSIIVKSFYEILQLATFNELSIGYDIDKTLDFHVLKGTDISIRI